MKKIIYILSFLFLGCSPKYYIIEDSAMIKESKIIQVKEMRAKRIIRKFEKIGIEKPEYKSGEMELYFEHMDSTIKFRPKEIKQLKK